MSQSQKRGWIARLISPDRDDQALSATIPVEVTDESDAANNQGAIYAGRDGVPADYVKAIECFRKAADAGHPLAQNNLGLMFASGHGVARSEVEACKWFRRAAAQGDAGGQFNLGNMCHPSSLGQLVSEAGEARIQAYMWFSLAAAQGYHKAQASSESLNVQMSNAEIQESRRRTAAFLPCLEKAG
jgi:uncharacterized protein